MTTIHYRTADIDGQSVFYREAGSVDRPDLLLLHGFPSSSFMFRNLIPRLADDYHVVAPDLLGFGFSSAPSIHDFDYTFPALARIVRGLLRHTGITRHAMYVHDIGAPVGWQLALSNPQSITAIVSQSGNAYVEGFVNSDWADPHAYDKGVDSESDTYDVDFDAIRQQYLAGVADPSVVDPDTWWRDYTLMSRPGNDLIQLRLLRVYGDNIRLYPAVQQYFRESQVPLLAVWGKDGPIFGPEGAHAFTRDLPGAQVELLPGGHFLLETAVDEVATITRDFLKRVIHQNSPTNHTTR
jgi:pimeloyl-ACP methyl ester carboxylesterase